MDKNETSKQKTKIIITSLIITALAILPWFLSDRYGAQISRVTEKIAPAEDAANLKEAMYYDKLGGGLTQCELCPNRCLLSPGQTGTCKSRKNIDGALYALNYGKPVTIHVDPIEKKPLFHFLPGAGAYSLATAGCNLSCKFCQNWNISQAFPADLAVPYRNPEEILAEASASGAEVIAFTYSEPIIFYEYMLDIAKLARTAGLKTVMISGGYINEEPLRDLLPWLDGVKIDLKAFSDAFYRKLTNGRLQPVLDTIKTVHHSGTHLEIVYLVIPGENDSEEEITGTVNWLKENIGEDAIIHFSRFHPDYLMTDKPPTPAATMEKAYQIAKNAGLKYVYVGNMAFEPGGTTYCADGSVAVARRGYFITANNLIGGSCADGTAVPGVWE